MRTILLACFSIAPLMPAYAAGTDARIESLDWLQGHWNRTGLPEGRAGHEHWHAADGALVGVGVLQRNGSTVFEEKLRIETHEGEVFYVADVPGNAAPVRFRMIEHSAASAVFENPSHDFPQRIAYRRDGEHLHATISGGGREIAFAFERDAASAVIPPTH